MVFQTLILGFGWALMNYGGGPPVCKCPSGGNCASSACEGCATCRLSDANASGRNAFGALMGGGGSSCSCAECKCEPGGTCCGDADCGKCMENCKCCSPDECRKCRESGGCENCCAQQGGCACKGNSGGGECCSKVEGGAVTAKCGCAQAPSMSKQRTEKERPIKGRTGRSR